MKLFLIPFIVFFYSTAYAQNPLQNFEAIIGGEWWLGDDSFQTFEWGVGELSVRATGYLVLEGKAVKNSEGEWFYHPGDKKIRGFFTAQNMPITFFDYETTFDEDGNMINTIVGYGFNSVRLTYHETWEFISENTFNWTLSSIEEDGSFKLIIKDTHNRK